MVEPWRVAHASWWPMTSPTSVACSAAILTRDGYEVVQAADGDEALEGLDTTVDVVITDLKMPRVDGMEPAADGCRPSTPTSRSS